MGIHLPSQLLKAEGITLQAPLQHSDRNHQQQPIYPLSFRQAATRRLEAIGFQIAKKRFAPEEPRKAPYPITGGLIVADQVQGLLN
jgi:hypothetical protein